MSGTAEWSQDLDKTHAEVLEGLWRVLEFDLAPALVELLHAAVNRLAQSGARVRDVERAAAKVLEDLGLAGEDVALVAMAVEQAGELRPARREPRASSRGAGNR